MSAREFIALLGLMLLLAVVVPMLNGCATTQKSEIPDCPQIDVLAGMHPTAGPVVAFTSAMFEAMVGTISARARRECR